MKFKHIEHILFLGPFLKIFCDFENGVLTRIYINGFGLSKSEMGKYFIKADNFFIKELEDYFAGRLKKFNQPYKFTVGTEFQKRIWPVLADIKYGEVISYKQLAILTGNIAAVRAAGGALSKNPLPIIVPCHRIIRSDGYIGGFTGGVDIKEKLLRIEGVDISNIKKRYIEK